MLSWVFCWMDHHSKYRFSVRIQKSVIFSGTRSKARNYVYDTWLHVRTRERNEDIAPVDQVQDKVRGREKKEKIQSLSYCVYMK